MPLEERAASLITGPGVRSPAAMIGRRGRWKCMPEVALAASGGVVRSGRSGFWLP